MRYEVREMSFAEILDTGFRLLRDHFVLLVVISASLNVPLSFAQDLLTKAAEGNAGLLLGVGLGMLLLVVLASPIIGVASTHAIGEVYLGRDVSIGDAFRKGLAILGPVLGTTLLSGLLVLGAMLLLVLPGIWVSLGLIVLSQVMVLEGLFGMEAIRRSLDLMKGQRWRAVGILFVVLLVQSVVGFGVGAAVGGIPVLGALGSGLVASVSGAYTAAVSVVLYFDIRCRKEAFEVEQLARIVEAGTARAAVS